MSHSPWSTLPASLLIKTPIAFACIIHYITPLRSLDYSFLWEANQQVQGTIVEASCKFLIVNFQLLSG